MINLLIYECTLHTYVIDDTIKHAQIKLKKEYEANNYRREDKITIET